MNKKTQIFWSLHNYCEARCSYCPALLWGGPEPRDINAYKDIVQRAITHYGNMGRTIDWTFSGGEPLHFHDFPEVLKMCKEAGGNIHLTTNGGKIWLDWWAVEPYIDHLNLSYHYWQNPHLIKFIIDIFKTKNKSYQIQIPIRPSHFEEDIARVNDVENTFNITVNKQILYNNAAYNFGMFDYSDEQLRILRGEEAVVERKYYENTSHHQKNEDMKLKDPSYSGMWCNAGIEVLYITQEGWAKGSECNDRPLGNIWFDDFKFPMTGHKCGLVVCHYHNDRNITKYKDE